MGHLVGSYLVGLPAAVLLGMFAGWNAWGVFSARAMEEIIKVTAFFVGSHLKTPSGTLKMAPIQLFVKFCMGFKIRRPAFTRKVSSYANATPPHFVNSCRWHPCGLLERRSRYHPATYHNNDHCSPNYHIERAGFTPNDHHHNRRRPSP